MKGLRTSPLLLAKWSHSNWLLDCRSKIRAVVSVLLLCFVNTLHRIRHSGNALCFFKGTPFFPGRVNFLVSVPDVAGYMRSSQWWAY